MAKVDEVKTAASSYILNFYQEVSQLTDYYSYYLNLLIELESKQGKDLTKMEEQDKEAMRNAVQTCRLLSHKCYIHYLSITEGVKDLKRDTKIIEMYKKINDKFIVPRETLEEFVILLNSVLVKSIMRSLLESSQAIVDTVLKE